MQLEGNRARDYGGDTLQFIVEQSHAGFEGAAKVDLFALRGFQDQVPVPTQVTVEIAHHGKGGFDELGRNRLPTAIHPGMAHCPAYQTAQHIAPPVVRWHHSVGDEEGQRSSVISQDPQTDVDLATLPVLATDVGGAGLQHRPDIVDFEDRARPLSQCRDPVQPGPGIYVLGREVPHHVIGLVLDVLHEDQVPELGEAFLVHKRPTVRAMFGPPVVEHLRRRPARPRDSHLPEIVAIPALDPIRRNTHLVDPDFGGFVVVQIHGVPQTLRIELEVLGDELVGPENGFLLEVVPKAEIAEHFEEGEMAVR